MVVCVFFVYGLLRSLHSLAMTEKWAFSKRLFCFTKSVLLQHDSKDCGGAFGVFYTFSKETSLRLFSKETCFGFALHRFACFLKKLCKINRIAHPRLNEGRESP